VAAAIALAQDFTRLVRERQPDQLDPWLARAAESPLVPLQRFAKGLRDDYDAVRDGIALPWSTGPVEGHINRLKMLKRQMFAVPNSLCSSSAFSWRRQDRALLWRLQTRVAPP